MTTSESWPWVGAAIGVLAIVLCYHVVFVAPRLKALRRILDGENDPRDPVESLARDRARTDAALKQHDARLEELERTVRREVHRLGFIRYNSFSDVGSDLSFALAFINAEGDGVVVTSIYSREETRTFGKAVKKFITLQDGSKEELGAIALARTGLGS
jgi:hypothetical protein